MTTKACKERICFQSFPSWVTGTLHVLPLNAFLLSNNEETWNSPGSSTGVPIAPHSAPLARSKTEKEVYALIRFP